MLESLLNALLHGLLDFGNLGGCGRGIGPVVRFRLGQVPHRGQNVLFQAHHRAAALLRDARLGGHFQRSGLELGFGHALGKVKDQGIALLHNGLQDAGYALGIAHLLAPWIVPGRDDDWPVVDAVFPFLFQYLAGLVGVVAGRLVVVALITQGVGGIVHILGKSLASQRC